MLWLCNHQVMDALSREGLLSTVEVRVALGYASSDSSNNVSLLFIR